MTEIKQLTAQLYARLGVGSRPRSTEAKLLEQIDLAAETLAAERDALRGYALWLEEWRGSDQCGEACPSDAEIAEAKKAHCVADLLDTQHHD
jgi:hypothetical protein